MLSLMSMTTDEYCAWLQHTKARAASMRADFHMEDDMSDIPMIDAYTPYLDALRAAYATREDQFAERFRAMRLRDLAAETRAVAELRAAHQARLAGTEFAEIPDPPDPYINGIRALRSKGWR
jgi:hypothetical protein